MKAIKNIKKIIKKMLRRQKNSVTINRRKKRYFLIKDFNTFMYDLTLHHKKNI